VDPPAAAFRDPADLLYVEVNHVTGPAGGDLARLAIGLSGRVEEPTIGQPEPGKMSGDRAAVQGDALFGQLVAIREADHFLSRRQVSICSTVSAGVAEGLLWGIDDRSRSPRSP